MSITISGVVGASTAVAITQTIQPQTGEMATNFYQTYRESATPQRLEFVDVERSRVGENIAGPGSPMVEGDIDTKLDRLGNNYSGVILA